MLLLANLLSKGLSFCPTPPQTDEIQLQCDLESYFRRLRLKEYFLYDDEEEEERERNPFKSPSAWQPDKDSDDALEMYIKAVRKDVNTQGKNNSSRQKRNNITAAE